MSRSGNERLDKLDQKIAQLKAQKLDILNREKEKERKERTRRLIQNGALAETYLKCEGIDQDDFKNVLINIISIPEVAKYLESSMHLK